MLTLKWTAHTAQPAPGTSAHQWLHEKLHITPNQHTALAPIETRFADQQRRYTAALHAANQHLADVISEDKAYTLRVAAAAEQVHNCMGDLQKASIQHVFEMRTVLSPEQGKELLNLARQSLEQSP